MTRNEATVEDTAFEWFGELGYAVRHRRELAPSNPEKASKFIGSSIFNPSSLGAINP